VFVFYRVFVALLKTASQHKKKIQFVSAPEIPTRFDGGNVSWKYLFRQSTRVRDNWNEGRYQTIDCRGHRDRYNI